MVSIALFRKLRQIAIVHSDRSALRTTPVAARTEAHHPASPVQARHRLTLAPDHAIQFTSNGIVIRVISGTASLAHAGETFELAVGEGRAFLELPEGLTIRAAGSEPLVFESVLDTASNDHRLLKQQFYARMANRLQLMDAEYSAGSDGF